MATEKLVEEITIKLGHDQKRYLVGLADIKGMTASDAVRMMIDRFIAEHKREFDSMQSIFGNDQ